MRSAIEVTGKEFPHNPTIRGYLVAYRESEVNFCPGCGRTHWYVGRVSAECAFCSTALPLVEASSRGHGTWNRNVRPTDYQLDAA